MIIWQAQNVPQGELSWLMHNTMWLLASQTLTFRLQPVKKAIFLLCFLLCKSLLREKSW
jgi:hypothetical protein